MQFIDLKTQYQHIEANIRSRMHAVLEHGQYIMGPEVQELETKLAHHTGAAHCITCASGTDALLMPLLAWDIGPGDAVFVPAFTFFATAEMVALAGASPIFVDVDPHTFNIQPEALAKAIQAVRSQNPSLHPLPVQALQQALHPRAIIPVDLFGLAADYDSILAIAKQENLLVLEDAAQAFGATRGGKSTCHMGCHAATTSFFPAKPLGCYGDGGAIFTDDADLAAKLRSLRIHGKGSDKYENIRVGINGRLDTLQAAILLGKLDIFTDEVAARQKVARMYTQLLAAVPGLQTPTIPNGCLSVYAQYSIVVDAHKRDVLCTHLQQQNIPTNIYYPRPLHTQTVFAHQQYKAEDMPVSTSLCQRIVSLPFHPYMQEEDVNIVCKAIKDVVA